METKRQIAAVDEIQSVTDASAASHGNFLQVVVRPAESADLTTVSALDQRITGTSKQAYWQDMLRRYGDGPSDRYFLVAETAEGALLGFVIGEVRAWEFGSPPAGWVFAINVDPDARLGGIGSRLFDEICQRFASVGVRSVRTMINRRDHLILSFFRSQGMMAGPSLELEMELSA